MKTSYPEHATKLPNNSFKPNLLRDGPVRLALR